MSVHLCQPNAQTSCGACCGMYNLAWVNREEVMARLHERRAAFDALCDVRAPLTLLHYRQIRAEIEDDTPLSPTLRVCPFLGIIDTASERVGCLVHPSRHDGIDGRDCGVYDRHTCAAFECDAYRTIGTTEAELIVRSCMGDSLRYGWVLNDRVYVQALLTHLRTIAGPITSAWLNNDALINAIADYFDLRVSWPYRDPHAPVAGVLLPESVSELPWVIDYAALGVETSAWDPILCALGSVFDDVDDLREAETWLDEVFDALTRALDAHSSHSNPGPGA